jgi:tetratricopeptide (TPR) repeat protein
MNISAMNCRECRRCMETLEEAPVASPDGLPRDARAHLAGCDACRRRAEASEKLSQCLAAVEKTAAGLSDAWLEDTRMAVMRGVRQRGWDAAVLRRPFSDRFQLPGWAWGMAAAAGVLLALGMVVGGALLGAWRAKEMDPHRLVAAAPATEQAAERPALPAPAKPAKAAVPDAPPATLASLREEFERLKATDGGVSREFLDKLRRFMAGADRSPDEQLKAANLLVATYEQLGEKDRALAAFENYLDRLDRLKGVEQATAEAERKAAIFYSREKDYQGALACYDLIEVRYPATAAAGRSRLMRCKLFERQYMWRDAELAYSAAARDLGDTPTGRTAKRKALDAMAVQGRIKEAIAGWRQYASEHPDEDPGDMHFQLGYLYAMEGMQGFPQASREYQQLLKEHPDHRYAEAARRELARITRQMVGTMDAGLLN